jgi:hypothetical protein
VSGLPKNGRVLRLCGWQTRYGGVMLRDSSNRGRVETASDFDPATKANVSIRSVE